MSFDHDGFLDPDEVLRLDELALTNLNTGMDLGLVVFFLCYTFVFNWAFDRVFGLPASAMAAS